jgi:hypothetical protein
MIKVSAPPYRVQRPRSPPEGRCCNLRQYRPLPLTTQLRPDDRLDERLDKLIVELLVEK